MKKHLLHLFLLGWFCAVASLHAQSSPFGASFNIGGTTYSLTGDATVSGGQVSATFTNGTGDSFTLTGKAIFDESDPPILLSPNYAQVSGGPLNGQVYNKSNASFEPLNPTITNPNGVSYNNNRTYTSSTRTETRSLDVDNDTLTVTSWMEVFTGSGISFTANGPNGSITGSESGYVVNDALLIDTSWDNTYSIGQMDSAFPLFGSSYWLTHTWGSTTYDSSGQGKSSGGETYSSSNGGDFTIETNYMGQSTTLGNDPYVGGWQTGDTIFTYPVSFSVRSAPRFVPNGETVMLFNGSLLNFQSSTITNLQGDLTEVWVGGGYTLTVTGNALGFATLGASASVSVGHESNGQTYSGQVTLAGGFSGFNGATIALFTQAIGTPLFSANTLYVDGLPFVFEAGYQDSAGNRTDRYVNSSCTIRLSGSSTAIPRSATVWLNTSSEVRQGTFSAGVFTMPGEPACQIYTTVLEGGSPAAFWINNILFSRVEGSGVYTRADGGIGQLSLTGSDPSNQQMTGQLGADSVTGTYNAVTAGVFAITVGSNTRIGCPANGDGLPVGAANISVFPDAVKSMDSIWSYAGEALDGSVAGTPQTVFYSRMEPAVTPGGLPQLFWLKIQASPSSTGGNDYAVSLKTSLSSITKRGFYNSASSLFHTAPPAAGSTTASTTALPNTYRTVPPDNVRWLNSPPTGLPQSFLVRGQPWWYAGEVGGQPTYRGLYTGQQMSLGTADATGQRFVTLSDPTNNNGTVSQGTLSADRGSIRFRDGTLALTGTTEGTQQAITHTDDFSLHTIRSDVDIIGNNLSFGVLEGDASLAGAAWMFRDSGVTASLHSSLSRTQADWYWWKQDHINPDELRAVMVLDKYQRLQIYPPPPESNAYPGVVLNPNGVSSFKGPVRVAPGGDISMGSYTEGSPP